jgi:hypothetical protein
MIFAGGHIVACAWFWIIFEVAHNIHVHMPEDGSWSHCLGSNANCWLRFYSLSLNEGIYLILGIDREAYSMPEYWFLALMLPVGALIHAHVLSGLILLIQRRGALETHLYEHTTAVSQAMRTLGVSPALQLRIISYFTYERIHRNGNAFNALFRRLSPQLRFELHLYLYTDLVANTALFRHTHPRVIREIVRKLNDIIFLPGDYICRYGEYGDSMYFIVKGNCTVIGSDNETNISSLCRGSYFGEVALLTGVRRTAFVRAEVFCILAHLTKSAFEPIIRRWPEEIDVLLDQAEMRSMDDRERIKKEAMKYYHLKGGIPERVQ